MYPLTMLRRMSQLFKQSNHFPFEGRKYPQLEYVLKKDNKQTEITFSSNLNSIRVKALRFKQRWEWLQV